MLQRTLASVVVAASLVAATALTITDTAIAAGIPDALTVQGEAGDPIVGAQTLTYPSFTVTGDRQAVEIKYAAPNFTEFWTIDLGAPGGQTLSAGFYEDAIRWPFNGTAPGVSMVGVSLAGTGGGCNIVTGRFVIDEITFTADTVASLVAHWEQHCEGRAAAGFGSVSWKGTTALSPMNAVAPGTFPNTTIDTAATPKPLLISNTSGSPDAVTRVTVTGRDAAQFTVTDDPCTGTSIAPGGSCTVMVAFSPNQMGLSLASLTVADTLHPSGNDTALRGIATMSSGTIWADDLRFGFGQTHITAPIGTAREGSFSGSVVITSDSSEALSFVLRPPAGGTLAAGTYVADQLDPLIAGKAGIDVFVRSFPNCGRRTARVVIRQIEWGTNGALSRLVANWEDSCTSVGGLTFNGTVPGLDRAVSSNGLGFNLTEIGIPVTSQITVQNLGGAPLHVGGFSLIGADAAQFSLLTNTCADVTLATGDTCGITVEYHPTTQAVHNAQLVLVDDAAAADGPLGGEHFSLQGQGVIHDVGWIDGEADDPLAGGPFIPWFPARADGDKNAINIDGYQADLQRWTIEINPPVGKVFTTAPTVFDVRQLGSADATHGGISIGFLNGPCVTGHGRVAIDQLSFLPDGHIATLVARWEYHCNDLETASFGGVRIGVPVLVPFPDLTDELTWDQVTTGTTSAPQNVTLTNRGMAPLAIGAASLNGKDAGQFSILSDGCSNTSLAPAATCAIAVSFHPTGALSEKIARLTVPNTGALMGKGGSGEDVVLRGSSNVNSTSNYGEFTPVAPARLLDTRTGIGGKVGALGTGATVALQVTGRGGVPSTGVLAVVVNVTATAGTASTGVSLWAAGSTRPTTASVNAAARTTMSNLVVVQVGSLGRIGVYNRAGGAQITVDVVGYYSTSSGRSGARFHPVVQARVMTTSTGVGVPAGPMKSGTTLKVQITGRGGVPKTGVTAVVVQVVTAKPSAFTRLTLWGDGFPKPTLANLTLAAGVPASNLAVVRLGPTGRLDITNATGSVNVSLDVVGYYTTTVKGGEGRYVPVAPARSINGNLELGGETWLYRIAGRTTVAHDAAAAVMNITAGAPTASGSLRVFSEDVCTVPGTSNVAFAAGRTTTGGAWTSISHGAKCTHYGRAIAITNTAGAVLVTIDVTGYFTH